MSFWFKYFFFLGMCRVYTVWDKVVELNESAEHNVSRVGKGRVSVDSSNLGVSVSVTSICLLAPFECAYRFTVSPLNLDHRSIFKILFAKSGEDPKFDVEIFPKPTLGFSLDKNWSSKFWSRHTLHHGPSGSSTSPKSKLQSRNLPTNYTRLISTWADSRTCISYEFNPKFQPEPIRYRTRFHPKDHELLSKYRYSIFLRTQFCSFNPIDVGLTLNKDCAPIW